MYKKVAENVTRVDIAAAELNDILEQLFTVCGTPIDDSSPMIGARVSAARAAVAALPILPRPTLAAVHCVENRVELESVNTNPLTFHTQNALTWEKISRRRDAALVEIVAELSYWRSLYEAESESEYMDDACQLHAECERVAPPF